MEPTERWMGEDVPDPAIYGRPGYERIISVAVWGEHGGLVDVGRSCPWLQGEMPCFYAEGAEGIGETDGLLCSRTWLP